MIISGLWEFCKKGDPPVMGITKLGNGVTMEDLLRPRRKLLVAETVVEEVPVILDVVPDTVIASVTAAGTI